MKILSKTPLRISLFGGGTDFPEYFKNKKSLIIGGAIDKYIYISLSNYYSNLFKDKLKIFYSKLEFVNKNTSIKHPVIKQIFIKEKIKKNIEIHIASDLPSNSGLGSSSSFSVGMLNLINFYKRKLIYKKKILAKKAIHFERKILGENVGYQDQTFASFGSFSKITLYNKKFQISKYKNNKLIKKIQNNLFLVYSHIQRSASVLEKKKIHKIKQNMPYLDKIRDIAIAVDKKLKIENNPDFIGRYLDETWNLKKKLHSSVSNKKIDNLYKLCIKNGATGGKLLGAGGGGFILMYVPLNKQQKFKKVLKNKLVKFEFVSHGSTIIEI